MEIPPLLSAEDAEEMSEKIKEGVERFDLRHRGLTRRAEKINDGLSGPQNHSHTFGSAFRKQLREIHYNRLTLHEEYDPFAPPIEQGGKKVRRREHIGLHAYTLCHPLYATHRKSHRCCRKGVATTAAAVAPGRVGVGAAKENR